MNNIRNTDTGEFGLSVADVRSWYAQEGRVAMIADDFTGALEHFESYAASEPPAHDPATHKAVQTAPVEIEGVLTQQWQIEPLSTEELAQREAKALAEAKAAADAARISITKRQALLALFDRRGIKSDVIEAAINGIEDEDLRYRTRVDWEGAAVIDSDGPTVIMLAAAIGLTEQDRAELFDYAKTL